MEADPAELFDTEPDQGWPSGLWRLGTEIVTVYRGGAEARSGCLGSLTCSS